MSWGVCVSFGGTAATGDDSTVGKVDFDTVVGYASVVDEAVCVYDLSSVVTYCVGMCVVTETSIIGETFEGVSVGHG